jgi:hypothetical protein
MNLKTVRRAALVPRGMRYLSRKFWHLLQVWLKCMLIQKTGHRKSYTLQSLHANSYPPQQQQAPTHGVSGEFCGFFILNRPIADQRFWFNNKYEFWCRGLILLNQDHWWAIGRFTTKEPHRLQRIKVFINLIFLTKQWYFIIYLKKIMIFYYFSLYKYSQKVCHNLLNKLLNLRK